MEHIMWRFWKYEQNMFREKCVRSSRLTPIILWLWLYLIFWIRYHLHKYMEHIMWRFWKYEQNMFGEKCVRSSRLTPIILWCGCKPMNGCRGHCKCVKAELKMHQPVFLQWWLRTWLVILMQWNAHNLLVCTIICFTQF